MEQGVYTSDCVEPDQENGVESGQELEVELEMGLEHEVVAVQMRKGKQEEDNREKEGKEISCVKKCSSIDVSIFVYFILVL